MLEYWNIGTFGLNTNKNFFTHHAAIPVQMGVLCGETIFSKDRTVILN
jgi:hypothetical protein